MSLAQHTLKRGFSLAIAAVSVAGALAACSSGSDAGTPSSAGATPGTGIAGAVTSSPLSTALPADYDGTDKGNFKTLAQPIVKAGTPFKVGFLNTNGGQPALLAMQQAAQAEVEKLGGTFIGLDASSDPQKQASQLNQLIAQHVNVIIGDPVVAAALGPGIAAAKQAGIPFVAIGVPADETQAPLPGAVTSVSQGFDYSVYRTMKALAAEHPGATFATMGLSIPVDQLIFMLKRMQYWGERFGLKFKGKVDTPNDTPAGFGPATSTVLTKYPDVKLLVTFNAEFAVAAATTIAASGRNVQVATSNAAQSIAGDALKAGRLDLVYRTPWEQQGVQSAIAAYDTVTKQNLPLPTFINVPGYIVTRQDAAKAKWLS
jgi:ribose transport system substrate-binding protein